MSELLQTPLQSAHIEAGAKMVDFAGWSMPVMYGSILEEVKAVRGACGMFDISHMGRFHLESRGACALLQKLTSNNVEHLKPYQAHYSLLTNDRGGIEDDIIVYCIHPEHYLVVVNASNAQKDWVWIQQHVDLQSDLVDYTAGTAMIAVQGPLAVETVARIAGEEVRQIGRFHWGQGKLNDVDVLYCRTGYTGEDGFELIAPAESAVELWNMLLREGVVPCGLGARDTLRIEAGYPLYGHEIDSDTTPVEAGLMWAVDMEKSFFNGQEAIRNLQKQGAQRRLAGLVCNDRSLPRQGYTVMHDSNVIGQVTSGAFSPARGCSIAMAYLHRDKARSGVSVQIGVRDRILNATVVPKKELLIRQPA